MKVIATEKAPGAIGPYSQGFLTNGFVYTSGQIPVNPADGTIPEGIAAQAEQSCKNVGAILEAGGSGFDKVVKTTCFLADIADFAAFNEVYAKFFTSKPARSCVAVKDLPKGVLCEVEAIAEACSAVRTRFRVLHEATKKPELRCRLADQFWLLLFYDRAGRAALTCGASVTSKTCAQHGQRCRPGCRTPGTRPRPARRPAGRRT